MIAFIKQLFLSSSSASMSAPFFNKTLTHRWCPQSAASSRHSSYSYNYNTVMYSLWLCNNRCSYHLLLKLWQKWNLAFAILDYYGNSINECSVGIMMWYRLCAPSVWEYNIMPCIYARKKFFKGIIIKNVYCLTAEFTSTNFSVVKRVGIYISHIINWECSACY